ncbi:MAG TPA: STAUR_1299 family protein [Syntrophobacteria bacterium]|nr:STAUR_1299 family protein [Syntrophobacteria bacterium]
MARYLQLLLDKAFETLPGVGYNQYLEDVTERMGKTFLFYEISLMEPRSWADLRDRSYPTFARYLKAKRRDPAEGSGVIVAVFVGERCHLLKGEDFLAVYREMERLDGAAFTERVRQWLSQSELRADLYPLTISNPRT